MAITGFDLNVKCRPIFWNCVLVQSHWVTYDCWVVAAGAFPCARCVCVKKLGSLLIPPQTINLVCSKNHWSYPSHPHSVSYDSSSIFVSTLCRLIPPQTINLVCSKNHWSYPSYPHSVSLGSGSTSVTKSAVPAQVMLGSQGWDPEAPGMKPCQGVRVQMCTCASRYVWNVFGFRNPCVRSMTSKKSLTWSFWKWTHCQKKTKSYPCMCDIKAGKICKRISLRVWFGERT